MNAVEKIEAAIQKLEGMRDERGYFEMNGWLSELVTVGPNGYEGLDPAPITNDELIVVLHRTIDAQLAILRETHYQLSDGAHGTGLLGTEHTLITSLADAILGDAS
ncbi:MAG: hypothetical protein ABWY57_15840 [Mycetocola sp.]